MEATMELKSFVTQALVEIVEGVQDAQKKLQESGAKINPRDTKMLHAPENHVVWLEEGREPVRHGQIVEFDVSVTASERDETQGGVGIQVVNVTLGLGLSGKTEDQNSVVSRLKFSVPVFLPEDK
jgi:hypothetical protein